MATTPEFSRPVKLDVLGDGAREITIEATVAERAALAQRFDLLGIDDLRAVATITRVGEIIACEGRLNAKVTQACVATGEPIAAVIDERFALRFVPEQTGMTDDEMELHTAELDEIGYAGSAIDLGEAVAQSLSLSLDPFPRSPDADVALRAAGVVGEEDVGPFAALKALKAKL